jgi:hypothetical protein
MVTDTTNCTNLVLNVLETYNKQFTLGMKYRNNLKKQCPIKKERRKRCRLVLKQFKENKQNECK